MTVDSPQLLCEPYLLDPFERGVHVVWHTDSPGLRHVVLVGKAVTTMNDQEIMGAAIGGRDRSDEGSVSGHSWQRFLADSQRLSLAREDADSTVPGRRYSAVESREVWRHLAVITGLEPGRTPYRVISIDGAEKETITQVYSLTPALSAHDHTRLLLTSDHQLKTMVAANIEMAAHTIGVTMDGVLMAGDLVNVPDRASDWFDSTTGLAFFATMTGRASKTIVGRTYRGAPILQHTPIFPCLGNHEVMGRWSETLPLADQFDDPQPIDAALQLWERSCPTGAKRDAWLTEHSWNTTTYEQLFPVPRSAEGGPRWYSRRIGDVFVASLFVATMWRSPRMTGKGKFQEAAESADDPNLWGYGQFIFEPIKRGTRQYTWLEQALHSEDARTARYRIVMFHHPSHGLGSHSMPALTEPVQKISVDPTTGKTTSVTYSYPLAKDHILRDVEPLLNTSSVNLVLNGHSHLWNRFRNEAGVNWLETSNVGNTYGAFDMSSDLSRMLPIGADYVCQGDPGGLTPIMPTLAPLTNPKGMPLAYIASNDITVFSLLDSGKGTVSSYRFDTRTPQETPRLFDEFPLD